VYACAPACLCMCLCACVRAYVCVSNHAARCSMADLKAQVQERELRISEVSLLGFRVRVFVFRHQASSFGFAGLGIRFRVSGFGLWIFGFRE